MTTPGPIIDRVSYEICLKVLKNSSRVEWDNATLNITFYIGLKDHVKNEITRMKRLEELVEMINTIIYINNQVYKQ
jgi:hypothetical protein